MQPRWYQTDAVEKARVLFRQHRALLLQLTTGAGKTPTFCWMIQLAVKKGKRVLVLAHRHELLWQCSNKLREFGVPHGLISPNYRSDISQPVQVASIQTMVKRVERLALPFDLIIIDEAHLSVANSYMAVLAHYPNAKILGVTGTSSRLDGRGLGRSSGGIYDEIICGPLPRKLIDEGFLVPIRVFSTPAPDISGVHIIAGEFNNKELAAVVDKPKLVGDSVSHYLKHAAGRLAIAFCCSIEHAQHTAEAFRQAGVRAVSLSGKSSMDLRAGVLRDAEDGKIDVITNAQLYIEGLDIPRVSCIILMSPTNSLTRYLQSVGRGARPAPGKLDLVVLDPSGCVDRFGLPDDDREWTLAGRDVRRKKSSAEDASRVCAKCFARTRAPAARCSNCGEEFPLKPREVAQVEGELEERSGKPAKPVDPAVIAAKREQGLANSLEMLEQLGRMRGMKDPVGWSRHVWAARMKKQAQRQRA